MGGIGALFGHCGTLVFTKPMAGLQGELSEVWVEALTRPVLEAVGTLATTARHHQPIDIA